MLFVITCSSALRFPVARSWSCRGVANDHPVPGDLPRLVFNPFSSLSGRFRCRSRTNSRCLSFSPRRAHRRGVFVRTAVRFGALPGFRIHRVPPRGRGGRRTFLRGMADFKAFLRCRVRIIADPFPGCDDLFFHGFCSPSRFVRWGRRHTLRASVLPLSRPLWAPQRLRPHGPLRCADLIGLIPGEFSRSSG